MIDQDHRRDVAAQVLLADSQSEAAVGDRIDDFHAAGPVAEMGHDPHGDLLADHGHAVGIGRTQGDALHPLGIRVHIDEGVAGQIDDDQVADIGRSPPTVAVEALAAQVQPVANADDLRHLGQAIRVGKSTQINFAQFRAVLGIDDQQGRLVVARNVCFVRGDNFDVVRVGPIAH